MYSPKHGIWSPEEIEAHPHDAIAWAKKEREAFAERGEQNANMDSGWSAGEAQLCTARIAQSNFVELTALRSLVKKVVVKMESGTTAWSEFQGWCPEFEALKTV